MPVVTRSPAVTAMSPMSMGRAPAASRGRSAREGAARSSTNATKLPRRAQSGQVPALGAAKPQAWQR